MYDETRHLSRGARVARGGELVGGRWILRSLFERRGRWAGRVRDSLSGLIRERVTSYAATPANRSKARTELRDWIVRTLDVDAGSGEDGPITVRELARRYLEFADAYYRKDGELSTYALLSRRALERFAEGGRDGLLLVEIGPKVWRSWRDELAGSRTRGLGEQGRRRIARTTANGYLGAVRRAIRWGVSEELVPSWVLEGIRSVPDIRRGRSAARETERVLPVPAAVVEATIAELRPELGAVVRFQLATGARPGETLLLRPCDLDRSSEPWLYRPPSHKTEYLGRTREIWVGPKAREAIEPLLAGVAPSGPVFRRLLGPIAGKQYGVPDYHRAIARAAERAGVPAWSPHRLRHTAATEIRAAHGAEIARTVLGHSTLSTTEIYAEKDRAAAQRAAEER